MSISGISASSSALIENAVQATLASSNRPSTTTTATATATASNSASSANNADNPVDALTQNVLKLLKALASGNSTQASNDLAKLKTDLTAGSQETTAKTDVEAEASPPPTTPLDSLVGKLTDSLNSGSVQGALQDLTKYLVQNGQSSGGLVNTTA